MGSGSKVQEENKVAQSEKIEKQYPRELVVWVENRV